MIVRKNMGRAKSLLMLLMVLGSSFATYNLVSMIIEHNKNGVLVAEESFDGRKVMGSAKSSSKYHVALTATDAAYSQWQCRIMYYWYKKVKDMPGSDMGKFTRILHSGRADQLMNEIPTFVVDPLPEGLDRILLPCGVRMAYIRVIKDMYDGVKTVVRTQDGVSEEFPIAIGLHQGSTLSPYLFTLVLDVLTEHIQEPVPQCMLFADDIVLVGDSRGELNGKLEMWRQALEAHGFRISRSKTEYMECKFSKRRTNPMIEVKIGDHIIPQVTRFKYLGSIIQNDGEIEGDVNHRIQAGWTKWRSASGVICDRKVPLKLKGKFYRTTIRPAMLYGTECWAVKGQQESKLNVAEMRMLRWMSGHTRQDKIRNECIREKVGVAPIVEKMVESRLRWFGHVWRRPVEAPVRRVDQMEVSPISRGRGRPRKTIGEVIKKDMEINALSMNMIYDRAL